MTAARRKQPKGRAKNPARGLSSPKREPAAAPLGTAGEGAAPQPSPTEPKSWPDPAMMVDDREPVMKLLANIKTALPELEAMLERWGGHWGYEDGIYRLYHQSWKVYRLQGATTDMVEQLRALLPERPLNEWFLRIVSEGTGKEFEREHNARWLEVTRPIVEAFLHAKFMLEMAVKYGKTLEAPPCRLPNGWAAILYLYDLR
jgi:hypothetical protein